MSDGQLQYEVEIAGTDQAAAGLQKVARGIDDVAAAEMKARNAKKARDYRLDLRNEEMVQGLRDSTAIEKFEFNIKRISHVTKETNPELKWMGEGFKTVAKESVGATSAMDGLRTGTVAASSAALAWNRLMAGDFVGAARAATMAVRTLKASMSAGMWGIWAAAAVAAIGSIIYILDKANQKKRELEKSKFRASELGYEIGENRGERENPYSVEVGSMSDARLERELNIQETAYKNAKEMTDLEREILASAPNEEMRKSSEIWVAKKEQNEEEKYQKLEQVKAEIERRKGLSKEQRQAEVDARQAEIDRRAKEDDEIQTIHRANVAGRRDFDREIKIDAEPDELSKAKKRLEYLQWDRKVADQGRTVAEVQGNDREKVEAEKELLEIDKEIRNVKNEIKELEKEDSSARRSLELRKEEYALSKMTAQEQLAFVENKMAALRKGPRTTEFEGQMLDLMQRRDDIQKQIGDAPDDGGDSADDEGGQPGRRRIGMGGSRATGRRQMGRSAQDWMRQQMAARRYAATSIHKEEDSKSKEPVEVKGVDKTNQLLETIAAELA